MAQLEVRHADAFGFGAPAAVEDLEHDPADVLFEREVVVRRRPGLDEAPPLLAEGLVPRVVGARFSGLLRTRYAS